MRRIVMKTIKKIGLLSIMTIAFSFAASAMNIEELETKLAEAKQKEEYARQSLYTHAFGKYGRDPKKERAEFNQNIIRLQKERENLEQELANLRKPSTTKRNVIDMD